MNRNATASWSGYLHQGKVGIFVALKKINKLIETNSIDILKDWKIEFESAEDFDIKNNNEVDSRHQIKAKKEAKYPNDYSDVLITTMYDEDENCKEGYDTNGTTNSNRFLHTIIEVKGFNLTKEKFEQKYPRAKFIKNPNNIQLYTYPDGKKWCDISDDNSLLKKFCINEIKKILERENHNEKDNVFWQEDILDHLITVLDKEIRKKHIEGSNKFPNLNFSDIYKLIISNEKYEKKNIQSCREMFSNTWVEFIKELDDNGINIDKTHELIVEETIRKIYEYNNKEFLLFLININPDEKEVETFDTIQDVTNLIKKDNIKYVFLECLISVKEEKFKLKEIGYDKEGGYRLTAINKPKSRVKSVISKMMNNSQLTKDMFNKRFIINGQIDDIAINNFLENEYDDTNWNNNLKVSDKFLNPNMEFISLDRAIKKLK